MYAARGLIGTGIAGGPDDIKRVVELLEERGIRLKGEHVALVVGMFDDQVRVTNTAQIRIEEKLADLAHAERAGSLGRPLSPGIAAGDRRRRNRVLGGAARGDPRARGGRRADAADRRRRRRQDDAAAAPGGRLARRHAVQRTRPGGGRCRDGLAPGRRPSGRRYPPRPMPSHPCWR